MVTSRSRDGGFTLIEILIVIALLGTLVAIVAPNLTGFLGRGSSQAYEQDRLIIQAASDAYYTDSTRRPGRRVYPTLDGTSGDVITNVYYINMSHLVSEGYLREAPQSARDPSVSPTGCGGNPGGRGGSYIWYVDSRGVVTSTTCDRIGGYANTYP